jgi:radical SAM superfamily enzyme YgiQ (UPF0313 family)
VSPSDATDPGSHEPGFFSPAPITILLAYSSGTESLTESTTFTNLLPIGICSLHALLRSHGHQAHLANLSGMSQTQIRELFSQLKPDLVGFSQWTHNRHVTLKLARIAKQVAPDCTVMLGGGHATYQAEAILEQHSEVDLIVAGEGEETLLELIAALYQHQPLTAVAGLVLRDSGSISRTKPRLRIKDLDSLPYPGRYLHEAIGVDLDLQPQFISTSRGCPSACRFCASPTFWGRTVRTRSPSSVVDEFLFQRQQFGTIYLSLRDDTFTADQRRTLELSKLLLERRADMLWNCQTRVESVDEEVLTWMKRAGCECVQLGVESGSARILQELGKRITPEQVIQACDAVHRVGLQLSVYLIAGVPGETPADQQATLKLLRRIRPHDLQVAPLAYYPGTALFSDALRHHTVASDLFEHTRSDALLALPDGNRRTTQLLRAAGDLSIPLSNRRISELKQRIGYCAVTCLQAGDHYLQQGSLERAEAEYREITLTEPEHPWGWLLLAELYDETGRTDQARSCYRQLLKLVPRHRQAQQALS